MKISNIRKFGLEHSDLPTMLWNVSVLLRGLTLNIDSSYTKRVPFMFYILTFIMASCYTYVYVFSTFWAMFWRYIDAGDMFTATLLFSYSVGGSMGIVKLIFMVFNEKTLKTILDGFRKLDDVVEPNSRMHQNIKKALRPIKKKALMFWIIIIVNGTFYATKPLLLPGRNLMEKSHILYGLEPMLDSPNYEINYILMFAAIAFSLYPTVNVTALLIILTGYTEAQMFALKEELLHLWNDAQQFPEETKTLNAIAVTEDIDKKVNKYIKSKLDEIIKFHSINISLIKQLESVYRGAVAAEFLILIICFIGSLLAGLERAYNAVMFALVISSMDCLTGQRLIDACTSFENAVYDCKWENFDVSNRKTVLLMLQMSQKTMTLSAGGIATLNFSSLMSVLRLVYSAYTTLRTTMH